MRKRRTGGGRVFRRKSRLSGRELPTYWIGYYVPGEARERQESAGTADFEEAKVLLRKRLGQVAEGKVKPVALERLTVTELLTLVEKDYADQGQGVPPGHIEAWKASLGHRRAIDVTREEVDDIVRGWRRQGIDWPSRDRKRARRPACNGTCNRYVATLRRAYSLGREKRGLLTALTFPHLDEKARGKYIPPADFYAINQHMLSAVQRDFCEFAYLNGIRKGQLRRTEKANVDPERWIITWRPDQTKNGEPHVLPLVGRSLEIAQRAWSNRRLDCPYLLHEDGRPLGTLRSEWNRACKSAGFPVGRKNGGYVFHNTRHSAVSNLNGAGVPDSVAMSISGHRTASVFQRYSIRQESVQRAAMEQVAAYIAGMGTNPTTKRLRSAG